MYTNNSYHTYTLDTLRQGQALELFKEQKDDFKEHLTQILH